MTRTAGSVAVVIPTKNGERFIGETLQCVAAQTRPACDVVVVDDGSTDSTTAIVRSFAAVRLIDNEGTGPNAARATGLAATDSDYVALLDHDDLWSPSHLEKVAALLDRSTSPAAFSPMGSLDAGRLPLRVDSSAPDVSCLDLWSHFPVNLVGGPSSVVVRRASLERAGGWPRWKRVPTDIYMWYRLADQGPFLKCSFTTAWWRTHHESQSANAYRTDPSALVAGRLSLLNDAVEQHVAEVPQDRDAVVRRLEQFELWVNVFAAMCHEAHDTLNAALAELSFRRPLESAPIASIRPAFMNALDYKSQWRSNIWTSYAAWPRHYRSLRKEVLDESVAGRTVGAARSDPRHPSRWGLPTEPGLRRALMPLAGAVARWAWRRRGRSRSVLRRATHQR